MFPCSVSTTTWVSTAGLCELVTQMISVDELDSISHTVPAIVALRLLAKLKDGNLSWKIKEIYLNQVPSKLQEGSISRDSILNASYLKPVPEMVIRVPPPVPPRVGLTPVMTGVLELWYVNVFESSLWSATSTITSHAVDPALNWIELIHFVSLSVDIGPRFEYMWNA